MAHIIINEAFLEQLEGLQMLFKNNYAGAFGGGHRSKTFGSSCEFADYRDYIPGDDVTKIDWNVYARTENLYQKLYYDERQMHTKIYIDASRSMEYGDGKKAEEALKLAAAFAYLSVCAMDKVSIYAIHGDSLTEVVRATVGKDNFLDTVGKLNEIEFLGESAVSAAIVPSNLGSGDGLSVIISDFLTDKNYEDAITHLADKRRDVLCIQILSREEINPQIRGKMHLFDSESIQKSYRKNIDKEIARAYKMALEYSTERIRRHCASCGANYLLVRADAPIGDVIFENLVNVGVLE